MEAARQRFKEGVEFFDSSEYEKARLAFLQAYALKPHPAVLLNLAQSELRSDHEAEAATHFAKYLREHAEASEEQRDAAREGLERAKEAVGVITLAVDASGADISVDGERIGVSPLDDPLYLAPGEHTIVAEKAGEVARVTLSVNAGEATDQSLTLGRAAPTAAAGTRAAEGAGEGSKPDSESAEEDESEQVAGPGRQPFFSWYADSPVAWVGTGLVVAGVTGGTVFAVSSRNYYDAAGNVASDIEDQATMRSISTKGVCNLPWGEDEKYTPDPGFRAACNKYQDRVDTGDQYKLYSALSFAAAGVFAVGTVVYWYFDAAPASDTARHMPRRRVSSSGSDARIVPIIGPQQGGVMVLGHF